MTYGEVDEKVERLNRVFLHRNLCPLNISNVEGTPNLKFIAIFSENRPEWYITLLAAQADSICLVPIANDNQYLSSDRISSLLIETEVETICVSKKTIMHLLNLKQKG
jgi:long-chain acyl-CoA synthetase